METFAAEVLAGAVNRRVQMVNGALYLRESIEQGGASRVSRSLSGYQSLQQFLAVSPWAAGLVVKAVAERVVPKIDVQAWVLDDTGFPRDGKHSGGQAPVLLRRITRMAQREGLVDKLVVHD